MNLKVSAAWLLIAVFCLGPLVGCKPADTKPADEPAASTTDS